MPVRLTMWLSSWLQCVGEFQCKAWVQEELPVCFMASKTLRTHHRSVHPAAREMQIWVMWTGCRCLFLSSIWCEPPSYGRDYFNIWLFPCQYTASGVSSFPFLCWSPALKLRFSWCRHSLSSDYLCFYLHVKSGQKKAMKPCRYTRILFQRLVFREKEFSINDNTKIKIKIKIIKKKWYFSFKNQHSFFLILNFCSLNAAQH